MVRLELSGAAFRHSFSSPWLFENVEFSLTPGIYGLFGPNGSGKTTMLQCIAGIKSFRKGTVRFTKDGRMLTGKGFRERLGYVSQEFAFYEEMRVADFLNYTAQMKLIPPPLIPGRAAELLDIFRLAGCSSSRIETLSTGQRRRLSIAQAMLGDPHLLLMDEPLEGLDMEERSAVMEQLHELSDRSIILMVSHILMEIEDWVDQVLFNVGGQVIGPKTPVHWKTAMLHDPLLGGSAVDPDRLPTLDDVYLEQVRRQKVRDL